MHLGHPSQYRPPVPWERWVSLSVTVTIDLPVEVVGFLPGLTESAKALTGEYHMPNGQIRTVLLSAEEANNNDGWTQSPILSL